MEPLVMNALIRTDGLSVGHGGTCLVQGIDLELRAGELMALIGVNGSGKSTLLRVLAGLRSGLGGTVRLDGRPVQEYDPNARARHIAMVRAGGPRPGFTTVHELVSMGRYPWTGRFGRSMERDRVIVGDAIERMGISELAPRMVDTLSDGEYQKVSIARALAQDTPVLLLDEPTAFLDLVSRVQVMRSMGLIAREMGKAVMLSTHDLRTALDMADRLALIHDGGVWSGTPAEARSGTVLSVAFSGQGLSFDPSTGELR